MGPVVAIVEQRVYRTKGASAQLYYNQFTAPGTGQTSDVRGD